MVEIKEYKRIARHTRLRRKIFGTSERPRLCIHRSLKNMQAQIVDDITGKVLFGISTLDESLRKKIKYGGNAQAAAVLGEALASKAKEKGINKISFDRGGYVYHGRVKAFAEAARKGGLEF